MFPKEERRERNTYIYSRGGGGGSYKLWEQKITTCRAVIKGYFHIKTEEIYNQKNSLVVWFPSYLILTSNLKS